MTDVERQDRRSAASIRPHQISWQLITGAPSQARPVPRRGLSRDKAAARSTTALLTLTEAARQLRRTPRRLRDFLRGHPLGLDGRPLFLQDGRDKLFSPADLARIQDVIRYLTEQGLPCHSTSGRHAREKRRTTISAAHTSESVVRRALALAGVKSPKGSSTKSETRSNVVPLPNQGSRRLQRPPLPT